MLQAKTDAILLPTCGQTLVSENTLIHEGYKIAKFKDRQTKKLCFRPRKGKKEFPTLFRRKLFFLHDPDRQKEGTEIFTEFGMAIRDAGHNVSWADPIEEVVHYDPEDPVYEKHSCYRAV